MISSLFQAQRYFGHRIISSCHAPSRLCSIQVLSSSASALGKLFLDGNGRISPLQNEELSLPAESCLLSPTGEREPAGTQVASEPSRVQPPTLWAIHIPCITDKTSHRYHSPLSCQERFLPDAKVNPRLFLVWHFLISRDGHLAATRFTDLSGEGSRAHAGERPPYRVVSIALSSYWPENAGRFEGCGVTARCRRRFTQPWCAFS